MAKFYETSVKLLERGYQVVPIRAGLKRPSGEETAGWADRTYDEKMLKRLSLNGYKDGNIGINARHTPAVDLDIYDESMADEMEGWLLDNYGETCVRVGMAPKRLLVYRTDQPFRKLQSTWRDQDGVNHKLEILGSGQQFIAYGVHPDTQKPYVWTSLDDPLSLPVEDLPLLRHEEGIEILEHYDLIAAERGWTKISSSLGAVVKESDGLEGFKPVLQITDESVVEALGYIENDDADYDDYMTIGFALHHQYQGDSRGLELWHEWAQRSSKYDAADVNRRYRSMGHGPDTATFATVLYRANEAKARAETQAFEATLNRIDACRDKTKLQTDIVKMLMKNISSDLQYDEAVRRVQRRIGELSEGIKPRLESVRKLLDKHRPKKDVSLGLPKWCENWYYVEKSNSFYNTISGSLINKAAFDAKYGRHLITDEMKARGESFGGRPSDVALNIYEVPTVYDTMYLPGFDEIAEVNGVEFVNTFNPMRTPLDIEPTTRDAKDAVRRMLRHFEVLFPDERERNIFLDYLAYTVQYPKEKITWGVLIQGVDGAGKSWFSALMAAVLGGANVFAVDADALKEKYTGWAKGSRMVFFEEVRVHGENRFEVLDRLKPFVTNLTVNIRVMQTDRFQVPNTVNYVMFTNYPDALPVNRNDRRYFVIRTSFQTVADLRAFKAQNPGYFADLFNILSFDAPALRWWFLNHEISSDFDAKDEAPATEAKEMMREEAEGSDDMDVLERLIADPSIPEISETVLLGQALSAGTHELSMLNKRAMGALLHQAGFAQLGRFRLDGNSSVRQTVYTRRGDLFRGRDALTVIREHLDAAQRDSDGF